MTALVTESVTNTATRAAVLTAAPAVSWWRDPATVPFKVGQLVQTDDGFRARVQACFFRDAEWNIYVRRLAGYPGTYRARNLVKVQE